MDLYKLIRYLDGDYTAMEDAELKQWLSNDPDGSHAALYRDAHTIYDALLMQPRPATGFHANPFNWKRALTLSLGAVAAIAIVLLSAHVGKTTAIHKVESLCENVSVPVGRTMEITLEDDTHVWLNSGTEISYPKLLGRKSRRLTLLKGELMLEVSKDGKRPFIVETASADVQVYGTRFDVESDPDKGIFTTTLFRGSVGVLPKYGDSRDIRLRSGQRLSLDGNGVFHLGSIPADDATTDWTEGLVNIAGSDFEILMDRLGKAFGTTIVLRLDKLPKYNISRGRVRVIDGIDHALDVVGLAADFKYKHDYNTDTIIIY